MTKTLIAAIATVALMTTAARAVEGEVPLHDSSGKYIGSVFNYNGTQTFVGPNGHFTGSSIDRAFRPSVAQDASL